MRVKRYRQTSSSAALSHEGSVRQRGGLAATTALPRERHTAPLPAGLRTRGHASSRLHRTDEGGLAPTGRRFPDLKIQCHDGGRFRLPLRGSPGFPPVFPLSRTPQVMVPDQQREARYRGLTECQRPPSADSQSGPRLRAASYQSFGTTSPPRGVASARRTSSSIVDDTRRTWPSTIANSVPREPGVAPKP